MLDSFIPKHMNAFCRIHPSLTQTMICTSSSCPQRLLCSECILVHSLSHKNEIIPISELLSERLITLMDQKISNLSKEDKLNKDVSNLLDELETSLETILASVKKQLFYFHRVIGKYKHKIEEKAKQQKHTFDDWIRFKEFFSLKRENFLNGSPGKASPQLEAFAVHYGSLVAKLDEDINVSEEERGVSVSEFDKYSCERFISKTLRSIEEYYNQWFLQIFPKGPKGKMEKKSELVRTLNINSKELWSMEKASTFHLSKIGPDMLNSTAYTNTQALNTKPEKRIFNSHTQDPKMIPSFDFSEIKVMSLKNLNNRDIDASKALSFSRFPSGGKTEFNLSPANATHQLDETIQEFASNDDFLSSKMSMVYGKAEDTTRQLNLNPRVIPERRTFHGYGEVLQTGEIASIKEQNSTQQRHLHKRFLSCSSSFRHEIK